MNSGGLYHPVTIGDLTIPGNLFLAPLAGYTDRAFREVCIREGANLTCSEMVSAEAVARGNTKTDLLMERAPSEELFAIQLFMPSAETAQRAAERVALFKPTIIDINCGCPVPKVVKTGAGSALMSHPETIREIVEVLARTLKVPVTVKIRLGWDADSISYLEAADAAVAGGAAMVAMHARTRSQGYSGSADWEHLARLKEHISVPVIGSGDLFSPHDARACLQQTGIDGIMFARGAVGNPFIFSDTRNLLTMGEEPQVRTLSQRLSVLFTQLDLTIAQKGEPTACKEMRKQFCAYTKGLPGAAALRSRIIRAESREDYAQLLSLDQAPAQW